MVNHALPVSVVEGRVERFDDELCSHVCRHRPTDDAAAEYVEHDRKKREAGQCWYAGDARNPEPIGLVAASYAARRRAFVSAVKDRSFLRGRTSVADSIDGVNLYRPHEFFRLAGLNHHRHRGDGRYSLRAIMRHRECHPSVVLSLVRSAFVIRMRVQVGEPRLSSRKPGVRATGNAMTDKSIANQSKRPHRRTKFPNGTAVMTGRYRLLRRTPTRLHLEHRWCILPKDVTAAGSRRNGHQGSE